MLVMLRSWSCNCIYRFLVGDVAQCIVLTDLTAVVVAGPTTHAVDGVVRDAVQNVETEILRKVVDRVSPRRGIARRIPAVGKVRW